ncbi:MAG: hypothetical protein IE878_06450 [Epsilonproteobacteria bacterium]|nr:hypothetical protein [Campylobacterota bacterium]MBD3840006.1 hypothetical protein [Campylobacterota bacterium]
MRWQFGFNPNATYNTEMYPDMNQESWHQEDRGEHFVLKPHAKTYQGNVLVLMGTSIFYLWSFYHLLPYFELICAPLLPFAVWVFAFLESILVQKILLVYLGTAFLLYCLFYLYRYLFSLIVGFWKKLLFLFLIYGVNIGWSWMLIKVYPQNEWLVDLNRQAMDVGEGIVSQIMVWSALLIN